MITIVEKFLTELERVGRWGVKAITRTASAVKYRFASFNGIVLRLVS
jgi:putative heme degradation protein